MLAHQRWSSRRGPIDTTPHAWYRIYNAPLTVPIANSAYYATHVPSVIRVSLFTRPCPCTYRFRYPVRYAKMTNHQKKKHLHSFMCAEKDENQKSNSSPTYATQPAVWPSSPSSRGTQRTIFLFRPQRTRTAKGSPSM